MRALKFRWDGLVMVVAGILMVVAVGGLGGCGISKEAQARQDDWQGRAMRAARACEEGKAEESAELLVGLWREKGVSPQPEGGIPERRLSLGTSVVLRDEKVGPVLGPRLAPMLAELEAEVVEGRADAYRTEVWFDLALAMDDRGSMTRVVEAGRTKREILKPLLEPREQRKVLALLIESSGRAETARVLELTDGEAFTQGAKDVLRFGSLLTPGLLASH